MTSTSGRVSEVVWLSPVIHMKKDNLEKLKDVHKVGSLSGMPCCFHVLFGYFKNISLAQGITIMLMYLISFQRSVKIIGVLLTSQKQGAHLLSLNRNDFSDVQELRITKILQSIKKLIKRETSE